MTDLTFAEVARVNRLRCERWHPGFPDDGWTGADWSNAMAGEAGEACNVAQFYGLDLATCVVDTFNRVSIREGFPERLQA